MSILFGNNFTQHKYSQVSNAVAGKYILIQVVCAACFWKFMSKEAETAVCPTEALKEPTRGGQEYFLYSWNNKKNIWIENVKINLFEWKHKNAPLFLITHGVHFPLVWKGENSKDNFSKNV